MAHFRFHIRDGETFIEDGKGQDLSDLDAARFEARQSARNMLVQQMLAGQQCRGHIEIVEESGKVLEIVPFGEMRIAISN